MECTLLAGVNVVAFAADDDLTDTVSVQKFYYDVKRIISQNHSNGLYYLPKKRLNRKAVK